MTTHAGALRVGVIGTGTIGRAVAGGLGADGLELVGLLGRRTDPGASWPIFSTLEELLARKPDAVVEAASHEAVEFYGAPVLLAGADLVCVSAGALADASLRERLSAAAAAGGSRLIVPSGGVGGLDALSAAAEAGVDEVVIEQRKPAKTLLPADEAERLAEPLVLFEGSVAEVVGRFPKTTNVAAAVALAGIGFERTRARVVADPALQANAAILHVRGAAGTLTLRLENIPSANPRTSAIVASSVLATIRRLRAPLVVPG